MAQNVASLVATMTSGAPPTPAAGAPGKGQTKSEQAFLEVRDPPTSQRSQPGGVRDRISFQFNPKELRLSKSATWQRDPQRNQASSAVPQFNGSDPITFSIEMFLDATAKMDDSVVKTVGKLFSLVTPTRESLASAGRACPPVVIFHWGGLTGFVCFVKQVEVTYSLFTPNGTPVRATAEVTLEELSPEHPPQNPTSGGYRPRRTHRVIDGDTLQSLAWREYADPSRWRDVARLNRIDDPMRLRPGTTVLLPAAQDLSSDAVTHD